MMGKNYFYKGIMLRFLFILLLFFSLPIAPAGAALCDVTAQVAVEQSPLVANSATRTSDAEVTVKNNSGHGLSAPIFLVVTGLPESISVYNAEGLTIDGKPMVKVRGDAGGLSVGQMSVAVAIKFHNPENLQFVPQLQVLADSHDLPPDPGSAADATLTGIDANLNGIRDDVELFIAEEFSRTPQLGEALNQFAQTVQKGLLSTNEQESMNAANAGNRAMECLAFLAPDDKSWKTVTALAVNTPERVRSWQAHQKRLSGHVFPARAIREWKTSCTFDLDDL